MRTMSRGPATSYRATSHPDDPRYRNAIPAAQAMRRPEQQLDKQFRKNFREVTDLWRHPAFGAGP